MANRFARSTRQLARGLTLAATLAGGAAAFAQTPVAVPMQGLPAGEGAFLLTTFWLADCLALVGRRQDARDCFERLLALRNDVGLLSEEYDRERSRFLGNFPQAFSHIGLINTAGNLSRTRGAADDRGDAQRS